MSRSPKALTLTRIEDLTFGAFASVPSSATLDHLIRFLSTWGGTDKLFMVIQYSLKLAPTSGASARVAKFSDILSDARMLFRIWGLLPIVQWLVSIERNRPPTRELLTIERMQGWSMLFYYPLEHMYYLLAHGIVPAELPSVPFAPLLPFTASNSKTNTVTWNKGTLGMWSCRYWAVYVFLQFAHLREDSKLLKARAKALSKAKAAINPAEKEELQKRRDALWNELIVNLAYLPMTLHWSLERGLVKNELLLDICGFIAAVASWRSGWKATALPSSAPVPPPAEPISEAEKEAVSGASLDKDLIAPLNLDVPAFST